MRPKFHYTAKKNWINDPNGLMYFKGEYHLYYQHNSQNPYWGNMVWGHATSSDLFNWTEHSIFMKPSREEDADGCFSGSAFVWNDEIYYGYTGVKFLEKTVNEMGNPVPKRHEDMIPTQLFAKSRDGFKLEKIYGNEIKTPSDINLNDFRDPKIFNKDGVFYMVIGARKEDAGGVVIYKSHNLMDWTRVDECFNSSIGFMLECPDYLIFENGEVILYSAMGLIDDDGKETYVTGYSSVDFEKTLSMSSFNHLDLSEKFYAPQTFDMKNDRKILMGWLRMENPVDEEKWTGMMSIPRDLRYCDGILYQQPVEELNDYRVFSEEISCQGRFGVTLLESVAVDVNVDSFAGSLKLLFGEDHFIHIACGDNTEVKVYLGDRNKSYKLDEKLKNLRFIKDAHVVELFINDGRYAITELYDLCIDTYGIEMDCENVSMKIHVLERGEDCGNN